MGTSDPFTITTSILRHLEALSEESRSNKFYRSYLSHIVLGKVVTSSKSRNQADKVPAIVVMERRIV